MEALDEEQLVSRLHDPETQRSAFEDVMRRYSEQLYWQIRRMVLSHDDADDVLQNTFIKAWLNIDSFRGESRISTWLYRIATNETLTFLSKQHTMQMVELDSPEGGPADRLEGDTYFSGNDAQRLLQEALLTLPDKQRLVFNMKYFQEMKYEEMSQVLGTSVGALKASYHLAVKKIEHFLESYF